MVKHRTDEKSTSKYHFNENSLHKTYNNTLKKTSSLEILYTMLDGKFQTERNYQNSEILDKNTSLV